MTIKHKDILPKLRERVPVGLRYGLELLEKTNGDIEKAESIFKSEQIDLLISKENVTKDIAESHLQKFSFDFPKAIESIRQEKYTITQRIFKFNKNKEDALGKIAIAIEEDSKLVRDFWIKSDEFNKLEPNQFTFMIIWEWLSFEEWEGFDSAIDSTNTDKVILEIKRSLGFEQASNFIKDAKNRKKECKTKLYPDSNKIEGYCDLMNFLNSDEKYSSCSKGFEDNKTKLIEKLYDFVWNRQESFPR